MGTEFRLSSCEPDISYFSNVVLVDDAPSGREITVVERKEIVRELGRMPDIARRRVLLYGKCGEDAHSSSGIWVDR